MIFSVVVGGLVGRVVGGVVAKNYERAEMFKDKEKKSSVQSSSKSVASSDSGFSSLPAGTKELSVTHDVPTMPLRKRRHSSSPTSPSSPVGSISPVMLSRPYLYEDKDREAIETQDDSVVMKSDSAMTETVHAAQDEIGATHPCQKSHLQLLLEEFDKETANMSESGRLETILQLPYIAVGYFDNSGGSLGLEGYGVHLSIPQGALPQGQDPQLVYIYVDPTSPQLEEMTPQEVPISPVVQCGPRGLEFRKNVILSFPHSAKGKDDQIIPRMCQDDPIKSGWEEFDGKAMFITDDRVISLVDHFTRYSVRKSLSDGSAMLVTLAAFGPVLDSTSRRYIFRVHGWQHGNTKMEKDVKSQEEEMSSGMLDAFGHMVFFFHQGDLVIKVTGSIEGWVTGEPTQEINAEKVENIPSNSVTFDLQQQQQQQQAAASSPSIPDLSCRVVSHQKCADGYTQSWNNVKLLICPQMNGPRGHLRCESQASHCTCAKISGTSSSSNLCNACKEQFRRMIFRKQHGEARPDKFGGLSEMVIMELCEHLDVDDANGRPRWKRLTENIGRFEKEDIRAFDFLEIYFEVCRGSNKDNEQSVNCLVADCRSVNYDRAVEIIDPTSSVPKVVQKVEPCSNLIRNGTEYPSVS